MNAEMQREPVRRKAVWGSRIRMAVALAGALLLTSCSEAVRTGQASSYLVITSLTGGVAGSSTVHSDVISDTGSVATDSGQVVFQLLMKDTGGAGRAPVNTRVVPPTFT